MGRSPRARPLPRARLILPPLSGEQALQIVNILDRAIAAIWRAHGDAMGDCLSDLRPHHSRDRTPDEESAQGSTPPELPDLAGTDSQESLPF